MWPGEFIEEPAPALWFDDGLDVDVSHLEVPPGSGSAAALAATGPASLDDDGLLTAIGAWRRLGSWAKAGELAAVAALLENRTRCGGGVQAFESAVSEIQLELTLTGWGAARLLELACPLADKLPGTMDALRQGLIDEAKARVIARAVDGVVDATTARLMERRVLPEAPRQTTGQLRSAVQRALIEVDPGAAERRRANAEADRRVELRVTDDHAADLSGRDLPADQALAADNRITALARALKTDGSSHSLAFLRAQVFLDLLLGTDPTPSWPPTNDRPDDLPDTGPADESGDIDPADQWAGTRRADQQADLREADRPAGAACDGPDHRHLAHQSGTCQADQPEGMDLADQWADVRQGAEPDDTRRAEELRDVGRPERPDDAGLSDRARFGEDTDADDLRAQPRVSRSASKAGCAGTVHLIVPLDTLLGMAEQPGEVPGHGMVPASVARAIAATATGRRWCYTVIDRSGRAVGHGHIPPPRDGDEAMSREALADLITARLGGLETRPGCGHGPNPADDPDNRHIQGAYRPPEALRHRVETRDRTCRFPTCRRPAEACDLDHTVPYDEGGTTCDCNLAPLCRKHHRLKQSAGWTLLHPEPGRLIWVTPTGRKYFVNPDPYA